MPQPRKYANRAQQQAAYRDRCAAALRAQRQAKGLPRLPAIPAMPGTARWRAAVKMAHDLLNTVCDEMQSYADDRSEQWQEAQQGEAFAERLTEIEQIRDNLEDYC
jgi:hypothetical protein